MPSVVSSVAKMVRQGVVRIPSQREVSLHLTGGNVYSLNTRVIASLRSGPLDIDDKMGILILIRKTTQKYTKSNIRITKRLTSTETQRSINKQTHKQSHQQ